MVVLLPGWLIVLWLVGVFVVQTGADFRFTRTILQPEATKRLFSLFAGNGGAFILLVLLFRLLLPWHHEWLIASREAGTMAIAVLLIVMEYFLILFCFASLRGLFVQELVLSKASKERRQRWWGYSFFGSLISLMTAGALFVAITIVPPLMTGVADKFEG